MSGVDNFKPEFKRYKQRNPTPDFADVIDLFKSQEKVTAITIEDKDHLALKGLKPVKEWNVYTLDDCPGFIIILNPFEEGSQRYWVDQCVKTYPLSPNVTNIDSQLSTVDKHDVWKYSKINHRDNINGKQSLIMKLRWVTLGYHYDWDNKKYYPDRYTKFPDDLSDLCKYVATVLGYETFSPEAGIVNYYHMDSTLGGHTDHSELDHDAPLISISFGQDAIFLLGGITKETKPSAVMLHSGDICIMSGQSRLVYHAVPRILHSDKLDGCIFPKESSNRTCNVKLPDDTCGNKSSFYTGDVKVLNNTGDNKSLDNTGDKSFDNTAENKSSDNTGDVKSSDNTGDFKSSDSTVKLLDNSGDFKSSDNTVKLLDNTGVQSYNKDSAEGGQTEEELLFREYFNCTRININVRQVLKLNEKFPEHSEAEFNNKRLKLDST